MNASEPTPEPPLDPCSDPLDDLLAFTPVPRKTERVDGWTAERQRGFIHALALTGSPRRAAAAVGKAQWGAEQLRKASGAESFNAAWDAASAYSRDRGSRRIAAGLQVVEDQDAAWAPSLGGWGGAASRARQRPAAAPPEQEEVPQQRRQWLDSILRKYLIKVEAERRARLDGRVVETDFYLRQMTWLETTLDLLSEDALKLLADFRADGHSLIDIAETPLSRILGEARRLQWAALGEPVRPEHPPRGRLVDYGRFSTEPLEATYGGQPQSHDEQQRQFRERHAKGAKEQVEWEAEQRRAYDRRRGSDAGP
ncbi:MAG TPA: hypothetical protein VF631_13230 [Allosphingosinicella sp.]|jgi:hypothetical protein|uniref:hypothetical protein n=1 Tax=Allosphingosinicella sp. TaxID=2823234 RepID=UPI002F296D47